MNDSIFSIKSLLIISLFIFSSSAMAEKKLSEISLSLEEQANYYDYQVDVFLQQEGFGDQKLAKKYPSLVKKSVSAYKFFINNTDKMQHKEIGAALFGDHVDIPSTYEPEDFPAPIYPTIRHTSDLVVNETIVIDYPLIVEGDLHVKGNLLIASTPILVTGDVHVSNHLFYNYSSFLVKGKVIVDRNAFLDGSIITPHKVSAKNIFSLSTSRINSKSLIPFPDSPELVNPSILPWSGEVDADVLFSYLKRDIEPFSKSYKKEPENKPWSFFLNSLKSILENNFYHPEIAGLSYSAIKIEDLSEEGKKQINKTKGKIYVQADIRTAQGFCVEELENNYLFDPLAYKKIFNKPAEVAIYQTLKASDYTSSCTLKHRYETFTSLLQGDLDDNYAYPYGRYTEEDYKKAYQRDKAFLNQDPYLATYWLLRYGLVFDSRYAEVKALVQQLEHPLVKSTLSFFGEKAYQQSVGAYTGRVFPEENKYVSVSELFGKYKAIKTGSDAFRRFHSDYIYKYYKKNNIRNKNTIQALIYALNNESSGLLIEKAMLLVEVATNDNLWDELDMEQPIKMNPLAWEYVRFHNPIEKRNIKEKNDFIIQLAKKTNLSSEARIKAINSLKVDSLIAKQTIEKIKQEDIDPLSVLGIKDKDSDEEKKQLAIKLLSGEHFNLFQKLLDENKISSASYLASLVIDQASNIAEKNDNADLSLSKRLKKMFEKEEAPKIDKNALLNYIDFATENNESVYSLEGAVKLLLSLDKKMAQQWASQQLQKSRLRWSDQRSISEVSGYVDLFRKTAE